MNLQIRYSAPKLMNYCRILFLIGLVFSPTVAMADSWSPWPDQLVASPNGKYYVVIKRTGGPKVYGEWGPVEYTICESGAEMPPISAAKSTITEQDDYDPEKGGQLYLIEPNAKVSVREGDKILGSGTLKRPPRQVLVSDAGLGFAGLDVYGHNYAYYDAGLKADNAVIIVSSTGKIIQRKRLTDLFATDERERFNMTAGGMDWLNYPVPGWIDDHSKRLVIIGAVSESRRKHLVRYIEWETGKVTLGPTQDATKDIKEFNREHVERKP